MSAQLTGQKCMGCKKKSIEYLFSLTVRSVKQETARQFANTWRSVSAANAIQASSLPTARNDVMASPHRRLSQAHNTSIQHR